MKMAKHLGMSRQTYSELETGVRPPRLDVIYGIAALTNRPIHWFVDPIPNVKEVAVTLSIDGVMKELVYRMPVDY
ncbi:helix-turn-helix transcriptional regulator [Vibrio parahaemolyticus]|nr:helix-turn-helix transcriptional regulator [Vibrio parahaemolyticus]